MVIQMRLFCNPGKRINGTQLLGVNMRIERVLASVVVTILASISVIADASNRDQRGEWAVQALYNLSDKQNGEFDSGMDVDSSVGFGFSLGYNFTSNLALSGEFGYMKPDYKATFVSDEGETKVIDHRMSIFNSQLNGIYNFGSGAFTPYVQAGLGFTYFDSNVATDSPRTGCWWTWYGYVCSSYYDTYDTTNFSYNLGAGLRYEFNRNTFVRGGMSRTWMNGSDNVSLDVWKLEIGQVF
jgi:opacity protein-like surface antigen